MTIPRLVVLLCAALALPLAAQEGHPLSGTWSGDWVTAPNARSRITLVMNWDGKAVTGTANPGPDAMTLARVDVDYAKWTVRLEMSGKDATGKPAKITAEGKLDDLGSWHRTFTGTWTQGATKGTFKLTRD